MEANDIQIGGEHYQREYQHWDFVVDTKLHYLLGCATKYISRWKDKHGVQDLRKAAHYISKSEEHDIDPNWNVAYTDTYRFGEQLDEWSFAVLIAIMTSDYKTAQRMISDKVVELECGADSSYTNQG